MTTVKVCWSMKAWEIFQEQSWSALKKSNLPKMEYSEVKFNTLKEAQSFTKGIEMSCGWTQPGWVILKGRKKN